jgi:putative ATPase
VARTTRPREEQATLFAAAARREAGVPLAERVRPRTLEEMVGQRELLAPGRALARAIADDGVPNLILWGPPGSGKTTLAHVIATATRARFVPFSAVLGGVAEVRRIVDEARERRHGGGGRTILFVDEIHRFNRAQQDAFLPHVEDGTVTLVGATTENPSFALVAPLLSRCVVYKLAMLEEAEIVEVLERATLHEQGLAGAVRVEPEALAAVAALGRGDARRALSVLELVAAQARARGAAAVDAALVRELAGHRTLLYDKAGDEHYDVTSAFIKSMRGSDPDAAVYWMMRMVEAGDDPLFVLRRMVIFASEDVGNADPRALAVAVDADRAFRRLGLPEGLYAMGQAATYLACAPKSNAAAVAWQRARADVEAHGALPVPLELRNPVTPLMRGMGYGAGYRYVHDEEGGVAAGAVYLPDKLVRARYYEPTDRGLEAEIAARLARIRGDRSA